DRGSLLPLIVPGRVHGQVLSDGQKPGSKALGILQPAQSPESRQQRLLEQVFGALAVAGFQVQPGEHQARGAADQFLERRPVADLGLPYQGYFAIDHAYKEDDSGRAGARWAEENRSYRSYESHRSYLKLHSP